MYLSKDLANVENKTILAYYVDELVSIPYISDMEMLYNMLANLTGHWGNDKVREIATIIVKRNAIYINENFPNPEEIQSMPHQASGTQNMFNLITLD